MKLVADIHLHSHYSRATSSDLTLEHLWKWAQIKGVQVVATGDIAHPGWLAELRDKLEPAEEGLFRLKPEHTAAAAEEVPASCRGTVRFLIGGEISNIYKKYDRTRKVHNIVFSPSADATARLQTALEKIGNIRSDGRPILGLDSRDLLEIVLEIDDRCHLIPAHIWTPWFSILGSKSGFDSVQECYADLTPHIFAVETGLSSDPPMNWRVSWLDDYTLISSSDAHSPQKLAREATCFDTELSYDALFDALRSGNRRHYGGTIEFFPEEGKYHLDGHRKCGVRWEPVTTRAHDGRCSACGKPVTVGVYHRMEVLADRPCGARPRCAGPFASLIPLPEALSEIFGVGPNSKRVQGEYWRLVERLGPELTILREVPLEEIAAAGDAVLAEGIRRMRAGEVRAQSGYDGEYGVIRMFDGAADRSSVVQIGMFDELPDDSEPRRTPAADAILDSDAATREPAAVDGPATAVRDGGAEIPAAVEPAQRYADSGGGPPAQQNACARQRAAPGPGQQPEQRAAPEITDRDSLRVEAAGNHGSRPTDGAPVQRGLGRRSATTADAVPESAAATLDQGAKSSATRGSAWLTGLNPAQRSAATHTAGPLAIVAGPGTGKTRTLTVRIAHMVDTLAVDPASILVLTFTHKAADELRERLGELLDAEQVEQITAGTFHQLGARLLEEFGTRAGIPQPFAIFDDGDRRLLLRHSFPDLSAAEVRTALAAISASKNGAPPAPEEAARNATPAASAGTLPDPAKRHDTAAAPRSESLPVSSILPEPLPGTGSLPDLATLRARYDSALAAAGALDLDDLVARAVQLLDTDPAVRRTLQARYQWISVDEYQDVNAAQYRLLRLLAGGGANLCTIGDPDQAIYGFRGADHRYFLSFRDDFPGAESLHLDRNYRSAQAILTAAGQVIARNPHHQATDLIADLAAHVKLEVHRALTDRAEAEYVVHQVERMIGGTSYFSLDSGRVDDDSLPETGTFADFAVLYRLNAQAKLLEEAFDRSGIPYQTAGGSPLAEQPPVREILALLWLAEVPGSRLHWRRVLLADTGAASEGEVARFLADLSAAGASGEPQALMSSGVATDAGTAAGSSHHRPARALNLVRELAATGGAAVAERVRAATEGWAALRGRAYDDGELERLAGLQRRADAPHAGMRQFLTSAALQSETDRYDERADRVALMSLHAAKGLEFPVVFIVGCEEGLLPYRPPHRVADPAEERRLFYVGMTRAQHRLILTHAARRLLFGQRMENRISGFITDIEAALREASHSSRRRRQPQAEDLQLPLF